MKHTIQGFLGYLISYIFLSTIFGSILSEETMRIVIIPLLIVSITLGCIIFGVQSKHKISLPTYGKNIILSNLITLSLRGLYHYIAPRMIISRNYVFDKSDIFSIIIFLVALVVIHTIMIGTRHHMIISKKK